MENEKWTQKKESPLYIVIDYNNYYCYLYYYYYYYFYYFYFYCYYYVYYYYCYFILQLLLLFFFFIIITIIIFLLLIIIILFFCIMIIIILFYFSMYLVKYNVFFLIFVLMLWCETWTRRCWLCHERVGSWLVVNTWWYERGGSYLGALVLGYEQGGSYVPCSHLRAATSDEIRSWWITCVGLRVERSLELDYKRGGS